MFGASEQALQHWDNKISPQLTQKFQPIPFIPNLHKEFIRMSVTAKLKDGRYVPSMIHMLHSPGVFCLNGLQTYWGCTGQARHGRRQVKIQQSSNFLIRLPILTCKSFTKGSVF